MSHDHIISGNGHPESDHARPRAFVSYAHESEDHRADVLAFCEFLASGGVDVRLDRWHLEARRDWQLWATRQILDADFVIVVASEQCRAVGDGARATDANLGLRSEMRLLRELYHADPETWTRRVLPVVLPGHAVTEIPLFLQPRTADHFMVTSLTPAGADDLLRILFGRPSLRPPCHAPLRAR
ncbi:TIR domain-containing protein [Streptosporangiaceae bacterium NEAU-GS5]|nr:TIR domain-containing protein [Streptosporangiaceae bacterium NEAU-GS5]